MLSFILEINPGSQVALFNCQALFKSEMNGQVFVIFSICFC